MAIFNCSGIPIPGITARLLGSRSSREKQYLYLEHFSLHYHFVPLDSHMLLPLVSLHISQLVGHLIPYINERILEELQIQIYKYTPKCQRESQTSFL